MPQLQSNMFNPEFLDTDAIKRMIETQKYTEQYAKSKMFPVKSEAYQDLEKNELKTGMGFNEYQDFVKSMKVYPEKYAIIYPTLGITGEGGEISEKVKKWLRGDRELDKLELLKEAGDVLWYLASLADDLGYTLQDLVNENVKKLTSRKERGVQKGDGDNR